MEIDLNNDKKQIEEYIYSRIEAYSKNGVPQLGEKGNSIKMIMLGYQACQDGAVALVVDTREDAESDGEWTMAFEDVMFKMPHWLKALDHAFDTESHIDIVKLDGTKVRAAFDDEDACLSTMIGEMLKDILLDNKESIEAMGVDDELILSVEDLDGCYGWVEPEPV